MKVSRLEPSPSTQVPELVWPMFQTVLDIEAPVGLEYHHDESNEHDCPGCRTVPAWQLEE